MPIIHFYSQCSTLLITGYANPAENNALWQLTDCGGLQLLPVYTNIVVKVLLNDV
jgi:hypothetical protein